MEPRPIASTLLHGLVLISIAMLLVLVILPAALRAAGAAGAA